MSRDSYRPAETTEFENTRRQLVGRAKPVATEARAEWFGRLEELVKTVFPEHEIRSSKPGLSYKLFFFEVALPGIEGDDLEEAARELQGTWAANLPEDVKSAITNIFPDRRDLMMEFLFDLGETYVTGVVKLRCNAFGPSPEERAERGDRDDRPHGGGYRDRDDRRGGGGGGGFRDRKPWENRDNRGGGGGYRDNRGGGGGGYRDRDNRGGGGGGFRDRKPWENRDNRGGGGDRRPWENRDNRGGGGYGGDRKPWENRDNRGGGDRKPWQDRDNRGGGERKPWQDRDDRGGDRKPWQDRGDRDNRPSGGEGGGADRDSGPSRSRDDKPFKKFGQGRPSGGFNKFGKSGGGGKFGKPGGFKKGGFKKRNND